MDSMTWKTEIIEQMQKCNVYNTAFDTSVTELAEILEERDNVKAEYVKDGGKPTVIHTLDRGEKNAKINPLLKIWMDLNTQALSYWNSLGLTPKAYKAMTGTLNVNVKGKGFEEVLADLGI